MAVLDIYVQELNVITILSNEIEETKSLALFTKIARELLPVNNGHSSSSFSNPYNATSGTFFFISLI